MLTCTPWCWLSATSWGTGYLTAEVAGYVPQQTLLNQMATEIAACTSSNIVPYTCMYTIAVIHAQMWACMHHGTSVYMQASSRNAVDGQKCSNGTEINSILVLRSLCDVQWCNEFARRPSCSVHWVPEWLMIKISLIVVNLNSVQILIQNPYPVLVHKTTRLYRKQTHGNK